MSVREEVDLKICLLKHFYLGISNSVAITLLSTLLSASVVINMYCCDLKFMVLVEENAVSFKFIIE